MEHQYERIAIVNRGEPAMRLIRAVHELKRQKHMKLATVALFTETERRARFVREADQAVCLGSATFVDSEDGRHKNRYLDRVSIEEALIATQADAVWVGWDFIAEDLWLAELCQRLDIVFIGPDASVLRLFGDKISTRHLAQQIGLSVIPWSAGAVETLEEAQQQAHQLGYPLFVKPARSMRSQGIYRVTSPSELAHAFRSAQVEGRNASGDATVFLERAIDGAHHIEVQIIADSYGTTWAVGVRDCTVQRHQQKIVKESASSVLSAQQKQAVCENAIRLCQAGMYKNAGTVEFLWNPSDATFWFLEVNPHLDVEHPVTEVTTALDLVKLQLSVAYGECLAGEPPASIGHATAVHLYAQDLNYGLASGAGTLDLFRLASGPGLRVDTIFNEGDVIPFELDPLLATISAWGYSREEAHARLSQALLESTIVVRGGMHNKAFLLDVLSQPAFADGIIDTLWLDRLIEERDQRPEAYADMALLQAAIEAYDAELLVEQSLFYTFAARGRPRVRTEIGLTTNFQYGGHAYRLIVARLDPQHYRVTTDGQKIDVHIEHIGTHERLITCCEQMYRTLSFINGPNHYVEVNGSTYRITRKEGGIVKSPGPAVVVSIAVAPGDRVEAGDRLIVVEVMKMEMTITAPFTGRISQVYVTSNVQVDIGAALLQLDPLTRQEEFIEGERIHFGKYIPQTTAVQTPQQQRDQVLQALRYLMLGYDIDPEEARRLLNELHAVYKVLPTDDLQLQHGEDEILSIFTDISSLFRREPDLAEAKEQDEQVHSAEQDLLTYLRSRDTRLEHLAVSFLHTLQCALAHYGIESLDAAPELDASLFAIYKAHQSVQQQLVTIAAILERRLLYRVASSNKEFSGLLGHLLLTTQGRYPTINDLANELRFRSIDEPLFEQVQNGVYQEMEAHLTALTGSLDANARQERMQALVDCPQPLEALLIRHFPLADETMHSLMLEVLTRRYYRIRFLQKVESTLIDGQMFTSAAYDLDGVHIHIGTMFAEYAQLDGAVTALSHFVGSLPAGHDSVLDFYVWHPGSLGVSEAMEQNIRALLNAVNFPRHVRHIAIAIVGAEHSMGGSSSNHFTYRPQADGYQEDRLYRDLHPMMGKRLDIWRLSNFKIKRLPSVEDVYLFHGIAHDNPKDERLFAIAEVRDVSLDETGKISQLPHLERMFMEALAGIRLYQSHLPAQQRLPWNRVLLYVWPPLGLSIEQIEARIQKLWPFTEGLGLEKVVIKAKISNYLNGALDEQVLHISNPAGHELTLRVDVPKDRPITTLSEYQQKVVQLRKRGLVYPYEIIHMLTPSAESPHPHLPPGDFTEYDLDKENRLLPCERPYGKNKAGIVVGIIRNYTSRYPEGMTRVLLLGDASKNMGAVSEPECRRINEAINLAERMQVPLEWFALSAGAKISMDSGTENMDWVSRTLRRLIEYTQAGGRVNIVVNGINVGAQPYWNAEANMLMHTRGILIMTPDGAMVLTGKQSLDYSGGVSAEDNYGIGGYERIMGPNGQAQYFAPDLGSACQLLMHYYDHTYVIADERFPRRAPTSDPVTRDVRTYPYISMMPEDRDLTCVGDLFSEEKNAGRKRPFDIRKVMAALIDNDHQPLERWHDMRDADTVVVWDVHIGGYPVAMLGIESRPIPRYGFIPGDGPEQWTAGTLFPMSSKKAARAINSASDNRPLVVIANLSGFDGSPESMYARQLEFGAEIGRAITNFKGPIISCTISRFHGGSFVVFSKALNENIEAAAVEGSYASVIGGVPAAAVVFAREVATRTRDDARVKVLQDQLVKADGIQKVALHIQLNAVTAQVHSEQVGKVASEFDHIHNIQRAQRVGSVDHVIPASTLRLYLVEALERGIARELQRLDKSALHPLGG